MAFDVIADNPDAGIVRAYDYLVHASKARESTGARADALPEAKKLSELFPYLLLAFPFFWLLESRSPGLITLALTLGFGLANGAISSVQPDYFARFFTANIRYSGISLGREAATVIGAGLAPVIATALVSWSGASWPVAFCMGGTSLLGLAAVILAGHKGEVIKHHELSPLEVSA